jgi:hypothetical protein
VRQVIGDEAKEETGRGRARNPAHARTGPEHRRTGVRGGEGDDASVPGFVLEALEDMRALLREPIVSEVRVSLGRNDVTCLRQQIGESAAPRFARGAIGQVLHFGPQRRVGEAEVN